MSASDQRGADGTGYDRGLALFLSAHERGVGVRSGVSTSDGDEPVVYWEWCADLAARRLIEPAGGRGQGLLWKLTPAGVAEAAERAGNRS